MDLLASSLTDVRVVLLNFMSGLEWFIGKRCCIIISVSLHTLLSYLQIVFIHNLNHLISFIWFIFLVIRQVLLSIILLDCFIHCLCCVVFYYFYSNAMVFVVVPLECSHSSLYLFAQCSSPSL